MRIGPNSPQEHIPDTRARWSVSARLNRYLPKLHRRRRTSTRASTTTPGAWSAATSSSATRSTSASSCCCASSARVYQQTAATFFKDAFFYETESTAGEYFTGDRELSPVRNATLGAKLTLITIGDDKPVWGLFDKLQLNVKGDIMMIDVLAADSAAMNLDGIDKQFIYGNSLIDARGAAARPARELLTGPGARYHRAACTATGTGRPSRSTRTSSRR